MMADILDRMQQWDNHITFSFYHNEDISKIIPIDNYDPLDYSYQSISFINDVEIYIRLYQDDDKTEDFSMKVSNNDWIQLISSTFFHYPNVSNDLYLDDILYKEKHDAFIARFIMNVSTQDLVFV
jgi:hypothetical protein